MTRRCGLIGHPVAHSRSPQIHRAFAEQTGVVLDYVLIDAAPDEFANRVQAFFAKQGHGLNVTVPHKAAAFAIADEAGQESQRSHVANTITRLPDGRLRADNTDGIGLVRDLTNNLGFDLADRQVLIAGAGGAAAGIIPSLLDAKVRKIVIVNRTPTRAEELVAQFTCSRVSTETSDTLSGEKAFDLVINATSASLHGKRPELPEAAIASKTLAYDLAYTKQPTPFMQWASAHGTRNTDGYGMLMEQAAESFHLWHGIHPDTRQNQESPK